MVTYNDDEKPVYTIPEDSGSKPKAIPGDKIDMRVIKRNNVPLEENEWYVLLELMGADNGEDRLGVDIVTVLDISGSMKSHGRLDDLKTGMQFLIKKLSDIDRLSIVTFNFAAERLNPLQLMSENAQNELEKKVKKLGPGGGTNIAAGLEMALQVLNDRTHKIGRRPAIILMSDGNPSAGTPDAGKVDLGDVPVHTFLIGGDTNSNVLNQIAKNSNGGTFSFAKVENTESSNLSLAFSQCLAGLLTVAVDGLKLTFTPLKYPVDKKFINDKQEIEVKQVDIEATIDEVLAGSYPQLGPDPNGGSRTIVFGNLYIQETRKVLLKLVLPQVDEDVATDVLQVAYSYSDENGQEQGAPPLVVGVTRTGGAVDSESDDVILELARVGTGEAVKRAQPMAEEKNITRAKEEIKKAQDELDAVVVNNDPSKVIEILKYDLEQLLKLMEDYEKKGRHYLNSFLTSHERQRAAARGDLEKSRMYVTDFMNQFNNQVKTYEKNPDVPPAPLPAKLPPPVNPPKRPARSENKKQDLNRIIPQLSQHLGEAIQSLVAVQESLRAMHDLLNSSASGHFQ